MRLVMQASLKLSTAPRGFTASELARTVADLSTSKDGGYTSRQAAYDLKKLRGKQLIDRIGSSHRYRPSATGLRAMTALVVLRHKVGTPQESDEEAISCGFLYSLKSHEFDVRHGDPLGL
jgi:hypothetical protein